MGEVVCTFASQIVERQYRFCQHGPVLFTLGLQRVMALLCLLQLLEQILKHKGGGGGQMLNSAAAGGSEGGGVGEVLPLKMNLTRTPSAGSGPPELSA